MFTKRRFLPFKGRLGGVFLLFFLFSCTAKQEKDTTALFATEATEAHVQQYYDLHEIQSSGTIVAGTLSGPDTYFEYHGREMGLQFELAEAFAQSIGVRLQMEISPDTASLLKKLERGEIDFIALEMPTWKTRSDEELLGKAIADWWSPDRVVQMKEAAVRHSSYSIRRHMRPVMQDATHGIISAYDDLFRRYSSAAGWDWRLLAAQCYQESGFDPQAVSSVGAQGLMQLMPATALAMGVPEGQVFDPEQNISASARYIRRVSQSFSNIRDTQERIRFTLAAYNGGVGHVQDAQTLAHKAGRDPHRWDDVAPFILHLAEPRYYRDPDVRHGYMRGSETEAYVRLIMERWQQYRGSARSFVSGSTPAPAKKSLHDGEYKSQVKSAEEWVPEETSE